MGCRPWRIGAPLLGLLVFLALPVAAAAHPLGNFTINHYAGIIVGVREIRLDVVIDEAEIPTFQERQRIDSDGDGTLAAAEIEAERQSECGRLSAHLQLTVGGTAMPLEVVAAGLSFPPGAAALSTMRTVCEYRAALLGPLAANTAIDFTDASFAERIGWREIVVGGDGATILTTGLAASSLSKRLTSYPQDLLSVPLDVPSVALQASPGGSPLPAWSAPDAFSLAGPPAVQGPAQAVAVGPPSSVAAGVPGGVGSEIAGLLQTQDLTLPLLILSLLTAMALGAGHALTPGHGKTIMAAYLVGTRGTIRHALALGLTVTVSHTTGVAGLAFVILAIGSVAPDQLNRFLAVLSGLLIVGIGLYLLVGRAREVWRGRVAGHLTARNAPMAGSPALGVAPPAGEIGHPDHSAAHVHSHDGSHVHSHVQGPIHAHSAADDHRQGRSDERQVNSLTAKLSWRMLLALGLFGGLVPSINALIILLATVASGRAVYGFVLVIAFGLGMALVLCGIGLGLVVAAGRMERGTWGPTASRALAWAPLASAIVIFLVGCYVTAQAMSGAVTF